MNKDVEELLSRGVGEFIDPDNTFKNKLLNNPEKVVIKFGIDPTRPDIHLGHAVILHKLRKLQDMGCKIAFLIGDYTAQIGDPTGKSKTRPEINFNEIKFNANTYLEQVGKILDISDKNKYIVLWNSIWYQSATDYKEGNMMEKSLQWEKDREEFKSIRGQLPTVTLWNFMASLRKITHSRLIERDMFQKRLKSEEHLYMHEMMYPVLQGLDSNMIHGFFGSCDLEVGGTDQTFNMLVGRDTMKMDNQEPQAVLAFKLLVGLDGKEKMSKSLDNYIAINDEPADMYGKVMSISDESVENYFELCTKVPLNEIEEILKSHPKEAKMRLALEITSLYHGKEKAEAAEQSFEETFSKGGVPQDIKVVKVGKDVPLVETLLAEGLIASKGEFTRLNKDGAIKEMGEGVYKIGKHRFIKIETE